MAYKNEGFIHEELGYTKEGGRVVRIMRPRSFRKPPGLKPVKGGRWFVRKMRNGLWNAWSEGLSKRWRRKFYTQEEAIIWSTHVAIRYAEYDKATADLLLKIDWSALKAYQAGDREVAPF
jgi:hypothetical protein